MNIPGNLLLLKQESSFELFCKYKYIEWLFPAFNNSFVVLYKPNLLTLVDIVDRKGNIMVEKKFNIEFTMAGMVSPSVVVVASTRVILLFDVITEKETYLLTK